jgi:pantetheine-phosphate adenylyltransferase
VSITALYPGSFDPPHLGHVDLIRRAAAQVDRLVVGVALNPDKQPMLSAEQRVALLTVLARDLKNVTAIAYAGATVAFAKAQGCTALIRGLRNAADLDAEFGMAQVNRANGLDTLFLVADAAHQHLSSRLVKLVANAGLPLDALVPPAVLSVIAPLTAKKPG